MITSPGCKPLKISTPISVVGPVVTSTRPTAPVLGSRRSSHDWPSLLCSASVGTTVHGALSLPIVGHIDEVRILNGLSIWSRDDSFVPPTTKFPRP